MRWRSARARSLGTRSVWRSEALANVVMHAYVGMEPGKMTVEAWVDEDAHFTVRCWMRGMG